MSKMVNVLIEGLNLEKKEFEILNMDKIEDIIDNLDWVEVYKKTYKEAQGNVFSGKAITYVDARNGNVNTYWMLNGNYQHPFSDYYEIEVCTIHTALEEFDDIELLNEDEYEEYQNGLDIFNDELEDNKWNDVYEFMHEKNINIEERENEIIEHYATCNDMDMEHVQFQLNNLYENQVNDEE